MKTKTKAVHPVKTPIKVVAVCLLVFVSLFLIYAGDFIWISCITSKTEFPLAETHADKKYIDKYVLKGFKQSNETEPAGMSAETRHIIFKCQKNNIRAHVVSYSIHFQKVFEVVYDDKDNYIGFDNSYD